MPRGYRMNGYSSRHALDNYTPPRNIPVVTPSDKPAPTLQEQILATFGDKAKPGPDMRPEQPAVEAHTECEAEEETMSAPAM